MSDHDVDLFIIGAGSGGVRLARIAAGHGARVAIAEEHKVGGTCVIRGCVPKKLLVIGAHFAEDLDDARRYGWTIGEKSFDWPTLRDNVLADVGRLNGIYQTTLDNAGVTTHHARATITGPNRGAASTARPSAPRTSLSPPAPGHCCRRCRAPSTASPRTNASIWTRCQGGW